MATAKKTTTTKAKKAPVKKAPAKKTEKAEKAVAVAKAAPVAAVKSTILRNPRITEKASMLVEGGCYTFDVLPGVTKSEIAKAIKAQYKVTPRAIRTVNMATKKVMPRGRRGKIGTSGGGKKAYVYLKKGDKIEVL